MKIIFLCGCAEPGKDGVGDYTRRLCGQLNRTGHEAQILSLCDKQASGFISENQLLEDTAVLVRRIPIGTSNIQRLAWTEEVLKEVAADWVSLQYVPYSFHPKGLPFWLSGLLKKLEGKHRWHLMFHELWISIEKSSPFKDKLIGLLQKQLIRKIKKSIEPQVVHTQAMIYQYYLSKNEIKADYLPLFGNVAVTATKNRVLEYIVFIVFATIHDNVPFEDFIEDLKKEMKVRNKRPKFVFVGRNGDLLGTWTTILEQYGIKYEVLGECIESEISQELINADYGISCTPYKISDKSGVVAAMREHRLPIISVAKPWVDKEEVTILFDDIVRYQKSVLSLNKGYETENNNNLNTVCDIFLKSLKK
jgi:hypothetical protein